MDKSDLRISAICVQDILKVMETLGYSISSQQIHKDFENGAPQNKDGSINIIHYAAWLIKEVNKNAH